MYEISTSPSAMNAALKKCSANLWNGSPLESSLIPSDHKSYEIRDPYRPYSKKKRQCPTCRNIDGNKHTMDYKYHDFRQESMHASKYGEIPHNYVHSEYSALVQENYLKKVLHATILRCLQKSRASAVGVISTQQHSPGKRRFFAQLQFSRALNPKAPLNIFVNQQTSTITTNGRWGSEVARPASHQPPSDMRKWMAIPLLG